MAPTTTDKLTEFARLAGTLAGLKPEQIPGLEELLRIVWRDGFEACRAAKSQEPNAGRAGGKGTP